VESYSLLKENEALLEVRDIDAGYGFLQVLWGISLSIEIGEYICLLGPNGAGKSTLLRTIAGFLAPQRGGILFKGMTISGLPGYRVCEKGISYISEETNLFNNMTAQENLEMGAYKVRDKGKKEQNLDFVFGIFPQLRERKKQLAGTMSGGERKMLAIARGLMSGPSLLLLDEPSLGLAPQVISDVFKALDVLRKKGMTLFLVEQNVTKALQVAERGYILEKGKIVLKDISPNLARNSHVRKVFLGI
jgi:ABC-type branched-subunit amino acid transport system ATPase component